MTFKDRDTRYTELIAALGALPVTGRDIDHLIWLCGWEQDTTDWLCDLFRRIHSEGSEYPRQTNGPGTSREVNAPGPEETLHV